MSFSFHQTGLFFRSLIVRLELKCPCYRANVCSQILSPVTAPVISDTFLFKL